MCKIQTNYNYLTNNSCESFHSKLKRHIGEKHHKLGVLSKVLNDISITNINMVLIEKMIPHSLHIFSFNNNFFNDIN